MNISTGRGDEGYTDFFSGEGRAQKNDPAFEVLGSVDELISFLGLCRVESKELESEVDIKVEEKSLSALIFEIQNDLFVLQAQLAGTSKRIDDDRVEKLEGWMKSLQHQAPETTAFSVPGEQKEAVYFDIVRTVCRRVERKLLDYYDKYPNRKEVEQLKYLNRLSDLLYCINRFLMFKLEKPESSPEY